MTLSTVAVLSFSIPFIVLAAATFVRSADRAVAPLAHLLVSGGAATATVAGLAQIGAYFG